MTAAQFDAWRVGAVRDYAQDFVDVGMLTPAAAADRAQADFDRQLGDGVDTPGEHLFVAYDGDVEVGMLWLHLAEPDSGQQVAVDAFVYDVSVSPDLRRRGYGRAIMEAGIEFCRGRGAKVLGLNVFGHNPGAKALYERLGFVTMSTSMRLTL
jgi:ribosomal protein S18 acetylase RimI-like enzyme